jgi:hypothetical protein
MRKMRRANGMELEVAILITVLDHGGVIEEQELLKETNKWLNTRGLKI